MIRNLYIVCLFLLLGCDHPESKKYNRFNETTTSNETTIGKKHEGITAVLQKSGFSG
jgi:hypothetical protein